MAHHCIMRALVLPHDSGKTPLLRHVVDKLYWRMAETGALILLPGGVVLSHAIFDG